MRSITRTVGCSINTVTKLQTDAAWTLSDFQDERLRNLPCTRLEVDEIWAFVYAKQKNVEGAKSPPRGAGDAWTWTAICADTKLLVSWMVGDRSAETAVPFMEDLSSRLKHRVQLTTDGHKAYLRAVRQVFGRDVDYAMLIKLYGSATGESTEKRYSPATCNGTERVVVEGAPDLDLISTSYGERHNLTLRMGIRRFTRLTNAFSKKVANHAAMMAVFAAYYNWCRPHKTLKGQTPAMAAGLTDRRWEIKELVAIMDERLPPPANPGPTPKGVSN